MNDYPANSHGIVVTVDGRSDTSFQKANSGRDASRAGGLRSSLSVT